MKHLPLALQILWASETICLIDLTLCGKQYGATSAICCNIKAANVPISFKFVLTTWNIMELELIVSSQWVCLYQHRSPDQLMSTLSTVHTTFSFPLWHVWTSSRWLLLRIESRLLMWACPYGSHLYTYYFTQKLVLLT